MVRVPALRVRRLFIVLDRTQADGAVTIVGDVDEWRTVVVAVAVEGCRRVGVVVVGVVVVVTAAVAVVGAGVGVGVGVGVVGVDGDGRSRLSTSEIHRQCLSTFTLSR